MLGAVLSLSAQDKVRVRGTLLFRGEHKAVANALVLAQAGDSTLTSCISSEQGYFECLSPQAVDRLLVRYMGADLLIKRPIDKVGQIWDAGICYLDVPKQQLNEVEVVAARPFVRYDAGRAIYNLGALPAIQGANSLEAMGHIPSLQFRPGEGFVLNGFEAITVLVDKRPLRMSIAELEAYLSSLPIGEIASVELVQNPSPEYQSSGQPVLNIITRKSLNEGYNLYTSLRGTYQKYLSTLANTRLGLNKGISRSYLAYGFSHERHLETTELIGIHQMQAYINPLRRHQLDLGTSLRFSPQHSLNLNAQGTLSKEHYQHSSVRSSKLHRPRVYTSLGHDYTTERFELRSTLEGAWASLEQQTTGDRALQLRDNSSFARLYISPSLRLGEHWRLLAGLGYERVAYDNRVDYDKTLNLATSYFDYKEQEYGTYLGLQYNRAKWYVQAGLDAKWFINNAVHGNERAREERNILLPNLSLSYQHARNHQLSLEVKSRYQRPSFRDITPITTASTGDWLRAGNTNLSAMWNYTTALRYSFMRAAQLELSYSDTQNAIVEEPTLLPAHQLTLRKTNLDYSRYLRVLLVLPIPIVRSEGLNWIATTTAAIQRQWDRGIIANQVYRQSFGTYYISHKQDVTLGGSWSIGLSATWYGPLYYGLYKIEPTWWAEASVAKSLGAWRFSLNLRDPWNSNKARGSYEGLAVPLSFVRDWHSPRLSLGISYSLGNRKLRRYQAPQRVDATQRLRTTSDEGVATGVGQN